MCLFMRGWERNLCWCMWNWTNKRGCCRVSAEIGDPLKWKNLRSSRQVGQRRFGLLPEPKYLQPKHISKILARIAANARSAPTVNIPGKVYVPFSETVNLKLNTWIPVACTERQKDFIVASCHENVWGNRSLAPPFLASALDGREWSASHSCCSNSFKTARGTHCIGGWVGPRTRNFLLLLPRPGIELRLPGRPAS
jgi:hypothetical protein